MSDFMDAAPGVDLLVQTVGTGETVADALVFTVLKLRPRCVVWCCTAESREATMTRVRRSLARQAPDYAEWARFEVEAHAVDDDLEQLTERYAEVIDRWTAVVRDGHRERDAADRGEAAPAESSRRAGAPAAATHPTALRLAVDFTSGTKVMSAALAAVGVARGARLLYATGPRNRVGRVTRTEELQVVGGMRLRAEARLRELTTLFAAHEYGAVAREATALRDALLADDATDDDRVVRTVAVLGEVAATYDLWDRFRWGDANKRLAQLLKDPQLFWVKEAGWDVTALGAQKRWLHQCAHASKTPSVDRLGDLLANVERRLDQGRWEDAAARLYRVTEYCAHFTIFSFDRSLSSTNDVDVKVVERLAPRVASRRSGEGRLRKVTLSLGDLCAILEAHPHLEGGRAFLEAYERDAPPGVKQRLAVRHHSFLAHGHSTVHEDDARRLHDAVFAMCANVVRVIHDQRELDLVMAPARFLAPPHGGA